MQTDATASKMSAVWKFFKIDETNKRIADCKLCSAKISRGGSKVSSYNTSNLIKHLKMKHKTEHGEFTAVTSSCTQQLTLQQTLARREKFSMDNPRAKKISEVVTQFIVLDDQPLSIVDNVGFRRLMNLLEPGNSQPPSCHRCHVATITQHSEKTHYQHATGGHKGYQFHHGHLEQ